MLADAMTRRKSDQGGMQFFGDIALCLIDEVHFLGEPGRGSSLEAGVVSRIRTVGQLPEMQQVRTATGISCRPQLIHHPEAG